MISQKGEPPSTNWERPPRFALATEGDYQDPRIELNLGASPSLTMRSTLAMADSWPNGSEHQFIDAMLLSPFENLNLASHIVQIRNIASVKDYGDIPERST